MACEFSIVSFIAEMKNYKHLWDSSKTQKESNASSKDTWLRICRNMFDKFDTLPPVIQADLTHQLKSKWSGLRRSYRLHVEGKRPRSRFPYLKEMSFMEEIREGGNSSSTLTKSSSHAVESDKEDNKVRPKQKIVEAPVKRQRKRASFVIESEQENISPLQTTETSSKAVGSDKNNSVLPEYKPPTDRRYSLRSARVISAKSSDAAPVIVDANSNEECEPLENPSDTKLEVPPDSKRPKLSD